MMRSLNVESSIDTFTATARALAWNKESGPMLEEMEKAQKRGLYFKESHVMEVVKTLAHVGLYQTIPQVCMLIDNVFIQCSKRYNIQFIMRPIYLPM